MNDTTPQPTGVAIHCNNCRFPLATSLGRSLVIGAVKIWITMKLECVHCNGVTRWYPAPKQKARPSEAHEAHS